MHLEMLCPIAGGNWNNGSNAGAWAVNFNNARTNSNTNVGFRADSAPHSSSLEHKRPVFDTCLLL